MNIDLNNYRFNIREFNNKFITYVDRLMFSNGIDKDEYIKININGFINLYMLMKTLEKENKFLISIIKSNYIFLIYFFDFFYSIFENYDYILKANAFADPKNQKKMLMFVLNEIYSFYDSFLNSNINDLIYSNIIKRYNNKKCNIRILFLLTNLFNERIKKANQNKIIKEYELLKKILIKFFNFSEEKRMVEIENNIEDEDNKYNYRAKFAEKKKANSYYSILKYQNSLSLLFKEDMNTFLDFIKLLINNCYLGYKDIDLDKRSIEIDVYRIIIVLMKINLEESIKIMPKLLSLIDFEMKKSNDIIEKQKNFLMKQIIKYIFNNSNNYNFYELNLLNEINIFNSLDSSLYILNDIKSNKANLFVMNRIKELSFVDNNKELFIEFIKKATINQFVFDTLFNSFSKEEQNDIFLNILL